MFCPGRALTNAPQAKAPVPTAAQAGRGVITVSASTAGGLAQKLQGGSVAGNPSIPTAVVPAAHIQTSPQAKVLLHVSGQVTVNQARGTVRTGKGEPACRVSGKGCLPVSDVGRSRCPIKLVNNIRK